MALRNKKIELFFPNATLTQKMVANIFQMMPFIKTVQDVLYPIQRATSKNILHVIGLKRWRTSIIIKNCVISCSSTIHQQFMNISLQKDYDPWILWTTFTNYVFQDLCHFIFINLIWSVHAHFAIFHLLGSILVKWNWNMQKVVTSMLHSQRVIGSPVLFYIINNPWSGIYLPVQY